ncbi:MAG: hypothetical protein KF901_33480 [Myxococcales bacterium]|nr:hypothetical protein [Myxococcales bacterium]
MRRTGWVGGLVALSLMAWGTGCDLFAGPSSESGPDRPPEAPPEPRPDGGPRDPGVIETALARPISGGHMLVHGSQLFVADPDRDRLVALEVSDSPWGLRERGVVALPVGAEPQRMSVDGAGILYVALRGTGQVARVDLEALSLLGTHEVCAAPRGLAWDDARARTWLACAGGELLALDGAGEVVERVFLEPDLRDVVVDEAGVRYVSVFREASVLRLGDELEVAERWQPAAHRRLVDFPRRDDETPLERVFVPNTAWRMRAHPGGGVEVLHQLSRVQSDELDRVFGEGYGGDPVSMCRHGIVATTLTVFPSEGASTSFGPIDNVALGVDFVRTESRFSFAAACSIGAGHGSRCIGSRAPAACATPGSASSTSRPRRASLARRVTPRAETMASRGTSGRAPCVRTRCSVGSSRPRPSTGEATSWTCRT